MKKGFTLVELLAVIIILAIIMIIAAPMAIKIINSSRDSAWRDNIKLIKNSLELNYSMSNNDAAVTGKTICSGSSDNFKNELKKISNLDLTATEVGTQSYNNSTSTCTFKLTPKNQFADEDEVTMTCIEGKCSYE